VKKRNGRSKGFGFAEFDAEDDQKKALNALNNKKIQERELIVKIALVDDAANATNNATNDANKSSSTTEEQKK
jgi:RNA recognition motif-containing protein